jgi:hypothetical protein
VAIVLEPSGKVSSIAMDPRFAGSDAGQCVTDAFRRVEAPQFAGGRFTVVWSFVVR